MLTEGTVAQYLKEIRKYRLLTFEEEKALSLRVENDDQEALEELINSNLRIVVNIAKKYAKDSASLMDYIQEGNLGLINAAKKFRASFEARFSTYACWWIKQYIARSIYSNRNMIKLPFRKEILLCKINRARIEIKALTGQDPSVKEIALKVNRPEHEVMDLINLSLPIFSIESAVDDENTSSLGDLIPDNTYNPEVNLLRENARRTIQNYFKSFLEVKEYEILFRRLNLDYSLKRTTLKELAARYSVSQETIRQTEQRAVKKLRKNEKYFLETLLQM